MRAVETTPAASLDASEELALVQRAASEGWEGNSQTILLAR